MTTDERERLVERWIAEYGDHLLRLCRLYLRDGQLAEDAFQETLLKAWRASEACRGEGEKTWLTRIAVNTCRDMLRRGWMRIFRMSTPIDEQRGLAAPQQEPEGEVASAVLALPGRYRKVVTLRYFEDMDADEIAKALRLPVNTVYSRLRRARAMLARRLGEEIDA